MADGFPMPDRRLRQAYRYCEWITYRHYENFPVASWLLPPAVRPSVAAVYAFARSADDFADERRYQGRSLELLGQWRAALRASCNGKNPVPGTERVPGTHVSEENHPIFLALSDTVRRRGLPVQLLEDLLTAFTMDVTKRRYADWEELMTYCRFSANPVGRLVLLLFGIRDPELHARSDEICTGLQLANHWQDLRIDLARDILYVPQDLMRSFGVTEVELKGFTARAEPVEARRSSFDKLRMNGNFQSLMQDLVGRTRTLFDSGERLLEGVSGGLRLELKLTVLGGRSILDRIESARYDVFRRRPELSGLSKLGLLARALLP